MDDRAPIVFAFETWPVGRPEWARVANHLTLGKARYNHWLDIRDTGWDVPYTAMRGRKVGGPQTSEAFARNAKYRGIPDVQCGDRVRLPDYGEGTIVGHDSSCNLTAVFPGINHALHVHPQADGVEFLPRNAGADHG